MRRRASRGRVVVACTVIGITAIAAGCGSSTDPAAEAKLKAATAEAVARRADIALCTRMVEPLHSALTDVKADLQVGINYSDYSAGVRRVARAYARMDSSQLSTSAGKVVLKTSASTDSTCLGAAASFEAAYNAYNQGNSVWNECIQNIGTVYTDCTSGPVNTRIQAQWSRAASAISNGETKLARLATLAQKATTAARGSSTTTS